MLGGHDGVGLGVPGVTVGEGVGTGTVAVGEGVPGVGDGPQTPLGRKRCSFKKAKVEPFRPPVLHISPPARPVLKKPAWLPWRIEGKLGGEATHAPAGQALVWSSS